MSTAELNMQNQIARQLPHYFGWMLVALLAFAGQARAASYVGEWDPAFGSDFPGLGWRGSAIFEIPDACLATDGIKINNAGCASNFALKMISAEVEFYDLSDPGKATIDTLSFTQPSLALWMQVTGGELSGVVGAFGTFDSSSIQLITAQGYQGAGATFGLGFVESPFGSGDYYAQMGWSQKRTATDCTMVQGTYFSYYDHCSKGLSELIRDPNRGPFLRFTQLGLEVPEPGSLALLLPAVGMLAVLRRRRHATAA
jgi:hypothetical protein